MKTERTEGAASVCVFCGSRLGHHHAWAALAADVGRLIAEQGWQLVFGAGRWGLMGTLAQAALENKGEVIGVIPRYLTHTEPVLPGIQTVEVVDTMIERKVRMMEVSDAFVILPGGIGTLEELYEVWTGRQTGAHSKPIILVNPEGFYDGLLSFTREQARQGFLAESHLDHLIQVEDVEGLEQALKACLSQTRVG